MKRVALILATLGMLCLAAGPIQAHEFHHGRRPSHGVYRVPVVVRPRVWAPPRVVVPPPPPAYVYPGYYYPVPSTGFYYQGRGLSIGVGF